MTAKILSFVLSIIFICGFLAGCGNSQGAQEQESKKNCYHKMATVKNLLTQGKFHNGDCLQVGGILVREPGDKTGNTYRLYGDKESIPNGSWIRVLCNEDWTVHGYIHVKGEWRANNDGYTLLAHGYFFPLWKN